MIRRLRTFAALLVLLTFSTAFAEQVWASTCDGAMRMGSTPSHAEAMAGMDHAPADSQQHPAPRPPECPLAAALAANGGCIFTFHPAPAPAAAPLQAPGTPAVRPAHSDAPDLLFVSPQFRPPKP
jgi:hypothetical protein